MKAPSEPMLAFAGHIFAFFCAVPLMLCPVANAQEPAHSLQPYHSRVWQMDDGLPHNTVVAITQTTDGYLWLAAHEELVRFDGVSFTTVPFSEKSTGEIQWIGDLCGAKDGSLWIGSENGTLTRYKDGVFSKVDYGGTYSNMVLTVYEDQQGAIWLGTRAGLFKGTDGKFSRMVMGGISTNTSVRSFSEDAAGNLWIGFSGGLTCIRSNEVVARYTTTNGLPNAFVRAVCCDRDGSIWIGSNAGMSRLRNGRFTHFSKSQGLPDEGVKFICQDRRGNLWAGTFGGLARWNGKMFVVEHNHDGEPFLPITAFFEDREGNFWMGTKEGLHRLEPKEFETWTTRQGLAHNNVISVFQDSHNDLWVGTWGGGLQRLRDGKWTTFSTTTTQTLKSDLILALCETRDGSLWFSMDYDGGLYRMQNGLITQHLGFKDGVPVTAVRVLYEDRDSRFWLGTSTGLFYRKGERFVRPGKNSGIYTEVVRSLNEDREGNLWVASESGLFLRETNVFKRFTKTNGLASDFLYALHPDADGGVWIGSNRGLNRMKDGKITAWTGKHGMPDIAVVEIIEDDDGFLWLGTPQGVWRVSKQELEAVATGKNAQIAPAIFGKASGMASATCIGTARPAGCKTKDGRILFATTKGLAFADLKSEVGKNDIPPPVVIEKVLVDKKELPKRNDSLLSFLPDRGELEFHYTALSFRNPEKNRFKYKLEGVDPDWIDAGFRRVAYYNNLSPGKYRFQVIGANSDDVWNKAGANVEFELLPHFWQTWWFKVAVGIAAVSLVAGIARYVTKRRMQLKLQRLEQQHAIEKERARIAQDMHDEVGAKLTKITFLGGLAKNRRSRPEEMEKEVDKILKTSRDLIGSLDEIVWAVDPRNDTLDNFANYLCRHATEFFDGSPIFCQLDIPDEVPHHPLTADVRHNLFLALKEALNNALKHSGASKVFVRLVVRPKDFEIEISDDGRGMSQNDAPTEASKTKRVGNGLGNMRRRLECVGGSCRMETAAGKGTRIWFTVPLSGELK